AAGGFAAHILGALVGRRVDHLVVRPKPYYGSILAHPRQHERYRFARAIQTLSDLGRRLRPARPKERPYLQLFVLPAHGHRFPFHQCTMMTTATAVGSASITAYRTARPICGISF